MVGCLMMRSGLEMGMHFVIGTGFTGGGVERSGHGWGQGPEAAPPLWGVGHGGSASAVAARLGATHDQIRCATTSFPLLLFSSLSFLAFSLPHPGSRIGFCWGDGRW